MAKSVKRVAKAGKKKSGATGAGAVKRVAPRTRASIESKGISAALRKSNEAAAAGIHNDTRAYNAAQTIADKRICDALASAIDRNLPGAENKVWHRHPVWFLEGNPIVGYSKLKDCIRLLFWSGQSFGEPGLDPEGSFKAAETRYTSIEQIVSVDLNRWLGKAIAIQWDYKNIVKRRGRLERLKQRTIDFQAIRGAE